MHALLRFCSILILTGLLNRVSAENFSSRVPAGSFLYLEARNIPAYRQRLAEVPALQKLKELDWKKLIIQLYQIGMENEESLRIEADELSGEQLADLLSTAETRWQELSGHLNGDVAFSVGNFKDVLSIFRFNERMRETLELAFDEMLDEENLTPEAQQKLDERMAEEARLDAMETAGILGQFKFWFDVKDGDALENKLADWARELLDQVNEPSKEKGVLVREEWEGSTLYGIATKGQEDIPTFCWAIKEGVWIITFSNSALKASLTDLINPPADSLANQPAYQDAVNFVAPADVLFYWDFAPLNHILKDLIAELPDEAGGPLANQLPKAEAALEWLALDGLLPYVLGSKLEAEGIRTRGRYGFSRETAISRILIDPEGDTAKVPAFLHKDFHQFAAFNWHLGRGWTRLEKELMALSPQAAAGLGLGRMLASGQVGFDLKLQFMDHLDGKMIFVQHIDPSVLAKMMEAAKAEDPAAIMQVQMSHPTGGQNYLFGMGMKDEAAIKDAFNRLMNRFHPEGIPEPVLFADHELFYPVPEDFQGGAFHKFVSYSYLDGYFLLAIGDDQLLKNAVLASGDPALQLSQTADFNAIQALLPQEAASIEYASGDQQKNTMKMLQSSLTMMQSENPDLEIPDLSSLSNLIRQTMAVSVRKGLVFEINSLMQFPAAE